MKTAKRHVSLRTISPVVAVLFFLLLGAAPASAHATLDSSDPSPSSVLETAPQQISLDFNEPINPVARSIEMYNQQGQRIVVGEALLAPDDNSVLIAGDIPDIPDGLYVVAWRAVSNDGHAVDGAYTFQIGASSPIVTTPDLINNILAGESGPAGLSWAMGIARFLGFLGLCAALGSLALLAGGNITSSRVVGLVIAGWSASLVSAISLFVLQGPYSVAGDWSDIWNTALWSDVFDTRLGQALVIRMLLLMVLAVLLWSLRRHFERSTTSWWRSTTALVGVGIALTLSMSGHPSASPQSGIASAVDVVHLVSVVLWVGGLLVVGGGGIRHSHQVDLVLRRFSRVATVVIPLAVISGLWQTWHLVPTLGDITQTTWGRTLVVKSMLAVAVVAFGALARWLIRAGQSASIGRLVGVEVLVAVLVLAVTSSMVAHSPEVTAANAVFSKQLVEGDMIASVAVTPGRVGNNEIHLTISTPSGSLDPVDDVTMRMTLPGSEIPTISVAVSQLGPNHYVGTLSVLTAGMWTLEILIQPDPSSSTRLSTQVPIAD